MPWSNLDVLSTDYTSYVATNGCTSFAAGAIKTDFIWAFSRTPLEIGTAAHTTLTDKFKQIYKERRPDILDFDDWFYTVKQTKNAGCDYPGYQ